jgi:hypothetical protein
MYLSGLGKYLVASTTAIWYFESGLPYNPVIRSICRSIKHIGSIALGSFLLTLVFIVQFAL